MPKEAENLVEAVGSSTYLVWTAYATQVHVTLDTPEWFAWVTEIPSFRFTGKNGKYTARKERRSRGGDYWIAYVKVKQKLYKHYLGPTSNLTIIRMEEVAKELSTMFGN